METSHHLGDLRLRRLEIAGKPSHLALPRLFDRNPRVLLILPFPELDPGRTDQWTKVENFKRRHPMGIHGEEVPLEIEHRDAIVATFDETSGELLATPESFFEMGRGHRHHPVTELSG